MNALRSLIHRELLLMPRRRLFYWKRIGFVALVSAIIISDAANYSDSSWLGLRVFSALAITVFIVVGLLGPSSAAEVIIREKKRHTLELLLLTDLSAQDIILGKFFAQTFYLLMTCISCLPLLIICIGMGGIAVEQILAVIAIICAFLLLTTAIGIFVAAQYKDNNAQIAAIALTAGILYCTSMASGMTSILAPMPGKLLIALSTILSMAVALEGKNLVCAFLCAVVTTVLAIPFLRKASSLLPKNYFYWRSARGRPFPKKVQKSGERRSPIVGNPIVWLDCHRQIGQAKRGSVIIKTTLGGLVLLAMIGAISPQPKGFAVVFGMLFFCMMLIATLVMFSAALRSFVGEKQRGRLELILLTSLSDWQIVWGKLQSIVRLPASFWTIGFVSGLISLMFYPRIICPEFFHYAIWGIGYVSVVCLLALYASIRCRSLKQALFYTLLIMVLWHIVSNTLYLLLIGLSKSFLHSTNQILGYGYMLISLFLLRRSTTRLRRYCC